MPIRAAVPTLLLSLATPLAGAASTVVTFSNGPEGWSGPAGSTGGTTILPSGGNPGHCLRTIFNDFGITFRTSSNPAFVGDFTTASSVTLAIDLRATTVSFFGQPVSRPWLVELRDFDGATGGYPYNSVWFRFGTISAATHGAWTTFSVTFDPTSTALPPGWRGSGAEDPVTYEPILPPGVTFADVLAGVDQLVFTTLQPGFFFGFTDFEVRVDNITVVRTAANPADLDGDGAVGAGDLATLLGAWGACPGKGPCPADLDGDGAVGASDLAALLAAWG